MNTLLSSQHILLACDLDGTVIPNGLDAEAPDAAQKFQQLCASPLIKLVYVSGQGITDVQRSILTYNLPRPAAAICNVGASIWLPSANRPDDWEALPDWQKKNRAEWGGKTWDEMRALYTDMPGLTLQKNQDPAICKISFEASAALSKEVIKAECEQRARDAGISIFVSYCLDVKDASRALIDILPRTGHKRAGVEHIAALFSLPHERIVVAGDSENDAIMLASGLRAILVANAREAVRASLPASDHIYIARGTAQNYRGGIIAGFRHFFPSVTF